MAHTELAQLLAEACGFDLDEYPDFVPDLVRKIKAHLEAGRVLDSVVIQGEKRRFVIQALRTARLRKEFTQEYVADQMCCSASKVLRMEKGATKTLSLQDLDFLIELYEIDEKTAEEMRRRRKEQ